MSVLVAISLVVLVGFAALAIDLGSGWASKRDLVADMDAAALAGARQLADMPVAACLSDDQPIRDIVGAYLELNAPEHASTFDHHADVEINCEEGTVDVRARTQSLGVFRAGIDVGGFATAVAEGNAAAGVMPLVICVNEQMIADFVAAGQDPTNETYRARIGSSGYPETNLSGAAYYPDVAAGVVHDVGIAKVWHSADCAGSGAGNWGATLFRSPGGGEPALQAIVDGQDQPTIVLPPPPPGVCGTAAAAGYCRAASATGAPKVVEYIGNAHACDAPSAQCPSVVFVIHGEVTGSGAGTEFEMIGLLRAIVRDANRHGNNANIHLEPIAYITEGSFEEFMMGDRSIRLCGADAAGEANTC